MTRIALTCALLALPMLASAASHNLKTFVEQYDANHDGSVTKEEYAAEREKRFAASDVNHDGSLSEEEYTNEFKARLAEKSTTPENVDKQVKQTAVRFRALDSNKDNKISPAEYAYSGWNMFTNHDYTKDGTVSLKDDVSGEKTT